MGPKDVHFLLTSSQMILMQFVSDAEFLEMDSQGRVLRPKPML